MSDSRTDHLEEMKHAPGSSLGHGAKRAVRLPWVLDQIEGFVIRVFSGIFRLDNITRVTHKL